MKAFKGIMGQVGRDLEVSKIEMDTGLYIQSYLMVIENIKNRNRKL